MPGRRPSRRAFLRSALLASAFFFIGSTPTRRLYACMRSRFWRDHPTPRPGITAALVLCAADLRDHPETIPVFDMVRQMPQIVDGIRCHCGCAEEPGLYSLLSCFERDGMAMRCSVCQEEARLASSGFKQGKSLDEIRADIDARFG